MCNKLNYVNLLENSWSAIVLLFPTFPEMKQSFAEPGETPGVFLNERDAILGAAQLCQNKVIDMVSPQRGEHSCLAHHTTPSPPTHCQHWNRTQPHLELPSPPLRDVWFTPRGSMTQALWTPLRGSSACWGHVRVCALRARLRSPPLCAALLLRYVLPVADGLNMIYSQLLHVVTFSNF